LMPIPRCESPPPVPTRARFLSPHKPNNLRAFFDPLRAGRTRLADPSLPSVSFFLLPFGTNSSLNLRQAPVWSYIVVTTIHLFQAFAIRSP
jgi:hypothetical protein